MKKCNSHWEIYTIALKQYFGLCLLDKISSYKDD